MAENLETKSKKAVLKIAKDVKFLGKIYQALMDLGMRLNHVIETKRDYHTRPEGIDYDNPGDYQ